mmetsp:Transcript_15247/g.30844  ORF Transcript_15247/g.30844 Transcript_15247/m.30844 type:complete len:293 (-) Transcript_15247:9-887(-)
MLNMRCSIAISSAVAAGTTSSSSSKSRSGKPTGKFSTVPLLTDGASGRGGSSTAVLPVPHSSVESSGLSASSAGSSFSSASCCMRALKAFENALSLTASKLGGFGSSSSGAAASADGGSGKPTSSSSMYSKPEFAEPLPPPSKNTPAPNSATPPHLSMSPVTSGPAEAVAVLAAETAKARLAVSSRVDSVHISAVARRRATLLRLILAGGAATAGIDATAKTGTVRRGRATLVSDRCRATAVRGCVRTASACGAKLYALCAESESAMEKRRRDGILRDSWGQFPSTMSFAEV